VKLEGLVAVMFSETPMLRFDTAREIYARTVEIWGEVNERSLQRALRRLIDAGHIECMAVSRIDRKYRRRRAAPTRDECLIPMDRSSVVYPLTLGRNGVFCTGGRILPCAVNGR
jgi:hypothetical protein